MRVSSKISALLSALAVLPPVAAGQAATEPATLATTSRYMREWPAGPPRDSVPDWARPGRIRFSRWDGGPIETAKAVLSGWPGFNPPIPDYLYVMTNWYRPDTIRLLRDADINVIWVTFSNGFSIETERGQREILRPFIDECHRQGIRVMAYHSVANMFWEDMFERVPESKEWISKGKDGKPVAYGAGDYTKMGRVTRYMADLSNAGWREYLKRRIDLAIDAGADGIMYDNCFSPYLSDVFTEIMEHALSRKPDFLVMANFHKSDFIENRLINAITTEEGAEAGIFTDANMDATRNRWQRERDAGHMLRLEGGWLATNIGRFRMFDNLSEGWKPVMLESRLREVGVAETHVMSPERHQLVMAENMMFNMATELFVEGRFAYGLWNRESAIVRTWEAIGKYNRFFEDNERYYTGARPQASVAVVLDNRSEGEEILNGLAARNVMYHVLYEHELTPEKLKPYAAVAVLTADMVRDRALAALESYAGRGKLFAAGRAAVYDESGKRRGRPAWFGTKCTYWERVPPPDDLAEALRSAGGRQPVRVEAPRGVLYNVMRQEAGNRLVVHLANYLPHPVGAVTVAAAGRYGHVRLLTPDSPRENPAVRSREGTTTVEIPGVRIYSLVVFEK